MVLSNLQFGPTQEGNYVYSDIVYTKFIGSHTFLTVMDSICSKETIWLYLVTERRQSMDSCFASESS